MKRLSIVIAVVGLVSSVSAQKKIEVSESNEGFSTGNHNALTVIVYGASQDDVEKAWKHELKDLKGGNFKSSKGELQVDDCKIKKMSDNTFDVYSKVEEVGEGDVKVIAAFDLGGAYLSSGEHKDYFPFLKDLMYNFGVQEAKAAIGKIIKEEEKKLEDLEKEKKDYEKDIENMNKEIEDFKKKIAENEKDIEETKKSIEEKEGEIKEQETVLKGVQEKQSAVK